MTIPRFYAGASLYRSPGHYRTPKCSASFRDVSAEYLPALTRIQRSIGGILVDGSVGGVGGIGPSGPGVAYASVTVECTGGNSYDLSTGSSKGKCRVLRNKAGDVIGGYCEDGDDNLAGVACGAGCVGAEGSGSCKLLAKE